MDGWIIAFQLPPNLTPSKRVRFQHKLWGRTTKTWKGKYEHHEIGLMESVPHRRLIKGVFLLRPQDIDRVTAFLREWKATHHVRRVALDPADQAALNRSS